MRRHAQGEDGLNRARNPESIHQPVGRYVHQVEVWGPNRLLFISGQVGKQTDGNVPADAAAQYEVALRNVMLNLEAAGFETTDLVKLITYLVADIDAQTRRATLDRVLGSHVTTSTLIYVPRLASPQFLVEVEAWAVRADTAG